MLILAANKKPDADNDQRNTFPAGDYAALLFS